MAQNKFDSRKHHRRSIRLKGYDYSESGAYFVTVVAFQRECLFGEIVDGEMKLNRYGEIVQKWWDDIPIHFPNAEIWAFVVMPNHIHGIIAITDRRGMVPVPDDDQIRNQYVSDGEIPSLQQGEMTSPLHLPTLGQIVAYFKYQSTKEMNALGNGAITKFWQRNYYEHIIRNEHEMGNIWKYIKTNPCKWANDGENPLKT
jgi:putative transposase